MTFNNGEYEVQGDYQSEGVVARKVQPIDCGRYAWCRIIEDEWRSGR